MSELAKALTDGNLTTPEAILIIGIVLAFVWILK
jgi:hypothetical protein